MSNHLDNMADIMPLPIEHSTTLFSMELMFFILFIAVSLFLIWQYHQSPIKKICRRVKKGKIDYRQAAHQLAKMTRDNALLTKELDTLRFQQQAPTKEMLLGIIKKISHHG